MEKKVYHITITRESDGCEEEKTLTKEEIIDAIGKVRDIYPNVMILDFDNQRNRESEHSGRLTGEDIEQKSPLQLFSDFYLSQNNIEMTSDQKNIFAEIAEKQEERTQ